MPQMPKIDFMLAHSTYLEIFCLEKDKQPATFKPTSALPSVKKVSIAELKKKMEDSGAW